MSEIQYKELFANFVTPHVVDDLDHLLPQLSQSAAPLTEEYLRQIVESDTCVFIATDEGRVVGVVLLVQTLILVGRKDWIEDVIVEEGYRGKGIAGNLMNMAEKVSRCGGAKSLNLTSRPERQGARTFYEKRGYQLRDTGVFRLTF